MNFYTQSSVFGFICGLKDSVLLKLMCSNFKNLAIFNKTLKPNQRASDSLHIVGLSVRHMTLHSFKQLSITPPTAIQPIQCEWAGLEAPPSSSFLHSKWRQRQTDRQTEHIRLLLVVVFSSVRPANTNKFNQFFVLEAP